MSPRSNPLDTNLEVQRKEINIRFADDVTHLQKQLKQDIELELEQQSHLLLGVLPEILQEGFHTLYIAGGAIYSLYNLIWFFEPVGIVLKNSLHFLLSCALPS